MESARFQKQTRKHFKRSSGYLQSEEAPEEASSSTPITKNVVENLVFHDARLSEIENCGTMASGNYDQDGDSIAGLANFLERPVRIASYTWAQGGGFFQNFSPWNLYFNTPSIKNKLQNYGKINCRLHLKFLINASPFHYGSLRACYFPLADQRSTFVAVGDLIPNSQTQGVWIEPQVMDTAEMVLPFLWPHNWLEITSLQQFTRMGVCNLVEYANLQSANGATSSATVQVYAWAEDVNIMGPTAIGALQSDEYATTSGTISGPATAVANIASRLTDVPLIGPFAKATEMGATMAAGVARLFGYSNPPVIDDVMPFQPKAFHAFSNSETRMPIDKLCLDPKNEVTVSSEVCGVKEEDPLAFKELLTKPSFLIGTAWASSLAVDTLLWSAIVQPHYAYLSGGFRTMPPVTYFSPNFRFWRGSLIYTFKFIKTRFHRGRVLISYDPNGDISGNADTETTTFSRVVDLEQEDQVEFVVPYKATPPLLQVPDFTSWPLTYSTDPAPAYTYDSTSHNGMITMRVQTILSGPTTAANIVVLTSVRAGDDFQFAAPDLLPISATLRDPAGVIQSVETESIALQKPTDLDVHVGMITTGEVIASMRPLCHRTHYSMTQFAGNAPRTNIGYITTQNNIHRIPPGVGNATVSGGGYNNGNPAAPFPYNFTRNNPIDWVLDCFVGYRGSTNLFVNHTGYGKNVSGLGTVTISRLYSAVRSGTSNNFNGADNHQPITGANSVSGLVRAAGGYPPNTGSGVTVTNPRTQAAIAANLPQYWPLRFYQAFHTKRDIDPKTLNLIYDHFKVRTTFTNNESSATAPDYPVLDFYQSAGVDFAPVHFLCTPRVFVTVTPLASDT